MAKQPWHKKKKWWKGQKKTPRCQRCGQKLKVPTRYCYWCGKRKGLW